MLGGSTCQLLIQYICRFASPSSDSWTGCWRTAQGAKDHLQNRAWWERWRGVRTDLACTCSHWCFLEVQTDFNSQSSNPASWLPRKHLAQDMKVRFAIAEWSPPVNYRSDALKTNGGSLLRMVENEDVTEPHRIYADNGSKKLPLPSEHMFLCYLHLTN